LASCLTSTVFCSSISDNTSTVLSITFNFLLAVINC
jgi:hypothetical protein